MSLELLVDIVAGHEDLAIVHGRVSVSRRDLVAVHVELLEVLEQLLDLAHVGLFVDRGVGADLEAGGLGGLDALDGRLEDAFALHARCRGSSPCRPGAR